MYIFVGKGSTNNRYLEFQVLIRLCMYMYSCRSKYARRIYIITPIKQFPNGIYHRNETFFLTFLVCVTSGSSICLLVRNHLFIATVYSAAYWYVYYKSIFHIGVCHSYCSFPLVIKIWKWSYFLYFFTFSHVIEYFGIIRKANITSNVFKMIIMIIIIMKHSLTYQRKKERPSLSFLFFPFDMSENVS